MMKKKSQSKNISFFEAQKVHRKRTKRAQKIDESKTAKKSTLEPTKQWVSNPASSDIVGIDTKKYKAQNIKQVTNFLKSTFRKTNKKLLKDSDFNFRYKDKAIVTVSPRTGREATKKNLQNNVDIRYNNVLIRPRKAKGKDNDFWIILKK